MKHFWIAFILIFALLALSARGFFIVWINQVKVDQMRAETERWEFIENACRWSDLEQGYSRAYIFDETTIKCDDIIKDYVPTEARFRML